MEKRSKEGSSGKKRHVVSQSEKKDDGLSPLKKLRVARAAEDGPDPRNAVTLSTVEDVKERLKRCGSTDGVIIRGQLLWISEHEFNGRKLVRMHLTDAEHNDVVEEFIEEMRETYKTHRSVVDEMLLTVTVWNETVDSAGLPVPGQVVSIKKSSHPQLFSGKAAQLTTKLAHVVVE